MYSLSTCWNSHRHTDGRAMLREIRDLGFEYAELSHGTRIGLLPGILEAVDAGEIKISSLHNFCPLPMGITSAAPTLYQFSAERSRERELAERYTLKTFELASRVKAPLVVLHLGSIEMKDYTRELLDMVGSVAHLPKNIPHAIRNPLKTPSRYMFMAIPAGLDRWFDALDAAKRDSTLDDALYRKLSLDYGIEWLE